MSRIFERLWLLIIIAFLVAILTSLFLWPTITQPLLWVIVFGSISLAVVFSVRRRIQAYRQKRINRPILIGGIGLDIIGILITIIIAFLLAGKVGNYFSIAVKKWVETIQPGMGSAAGILAGLLTGVVVGLGVAIIMKRIFDFIEKLGFGKSLHAIADINRR